MKLFFALLFVAAGYTAFLLSTTDTVMDQTARLNTTYQYVADNADRIAAGKSALPQTN